MSYIIDGYNLLRYAQQHDDYEALEDASLCHVLNLFLKRVNERAQIVFDGIGPPDKSGLRSRGNIEVYFSGRGIEADDIIEGKVMASTDPANLVIISSDRQIRTVARQRKATAITSDVFWMILCHELDKKKGKPEPREKRQGINNSETDQWLDEFGL
ncbi:putative RNA-binding protein containing a PIN domain protein [Anaerohalosphaera lusitana]|uniref:Putative RNA-binding protein containing a PIN domain protein n=1 Tax=Anaerohalosphaera lusitana TaxID=1936003 RepID=A0A1U9NQQ2_9BACT|nr:NYN domain-containing protein [Anaerohalosphaera lusitana]AQT70239.1 putative RNA-binding protein containing a PIN domain protein [Anaerohalosphaera lusitana]